ncbi:MAG: helix-turn-helix domain-containing protein, partial [Meiothermus sp.]|nr:helix-turn-helix domain-containing protein [Meiothermus sp.]
MCELGKRLKESREAKGLDLAQAAEVLKVGSVIMQAPEDCRFDELPEPALARG